MSPERERRLIFVLAVVQFVNILDFMMVMPLGPDLACSLGIPLSKLGVIGGSYTAAAALSGFACAFFLDRFDRRPALALSLFGLALGTFAGGFANGLGTLVGARVFAGAFGGPATAIAMSILADVVPVERRGRALGTVMMAFAVASVLGVPAGLELARLGGWHLPFFAVGALGLVATALAYVFVPSLTGHLARATDERRAPVLSEFSAILRRSTTQLALLGSAVSNFGLFILIPNLAAFTQGNLGYPRNKLGLLYLAGGAASFVTLRPFGRLVDRHGSFKVALAGTLLTIVVILAGFVFAWRWIPVPLIFLGFMVCNGLRNVSVQTLSTRVPTADERARFMSLQSMTQHMFSAFGAFASSQMLGQTGGEGGITPASCGARERVLPALVGIDRVAWVSIASMAVLPWIMLAIERQVNARDAEAVDKP
jgi:predicted MFS family arabinose efflux permease